MQAFLDILLAFWATLAEMAPWLVIGFLFAGVLSVFFKASFVQRHLGRGPGAVVKASVLGVPLPLCSCGVIPVSAGLYRQGASRGATSSFLLSTPQTGVDSILATYALMGPVFAIVRPAIALINGVLGGWLIDAADPGPGQRSGKPASAAESDQVTRPAAAANVSPLPVLAGGSCCSGGDSSSPAPATAADADAAPCCGSASPPAPSAGWLPKFKQVLRYGLVTLPADIAGSLLLGLTVAALLTALLPADVLAPYLGGGMLAMLAAVLVGTPLYICSTGSIPVALGLLAAGASPGAVLAFLIAGPATNAATVSVTWNLLGPRTGLIYLLSVAVTAVASGLLLDTFYPSLQTLAIPESALEPHHAGLAWNQHLWAAALLALLLPAIAHRLRKALSRTESSSCCSAPAAEPVTG